MYLQNSNSNSVCLAKKATSTRRKLIVSLGLILSVLMMLVSFFVINNPMTARAESTTTPATVTVGELWNKETYSFDSSNLAILQRYIYGGEDVRPSYIEEMAKVGLDRTELNAKTLPAGFYKDTAYSAKSSTQDIIVTLHGYEWYVTALYENITKENFELSILELSPVKISTLSSISTMPEFTDKIDGFALYIDYSIYDISSGKVPFVISNANKTTYDLSNAVFVKGNTENSESIITLNSERLTPNLDYKVDTTVNDGESLVVDGNGMYSDYNQEDGISIVEPKASFNVRWTAELDGASLRTPYGSIWAGGDALQAVISYSYCGSNEETYTTKYNPGTYTWTVYYYSSAIGTATWIIDKADLDNYGNFVLSFTSKTFTGSKITNSITTAQIEGRQGWKTLSTTNYSTSGTFSATDAGTYRITITGKNYCTGTYPIDWKILPGLLSKYSVCTTATSFYYTGSAITYDKIWIQDYDFDMHDGSAVYIDFGSYNEDDDFYLGGTYSATNPGTYSMTVNGQGNFSGSVTVSWTIQKVPIGNCTITYSNPQYYQAAQITPSVTVKNGSTTLTKGTHYTVSYGTNKSANSGNGTGTITITGKGSYYTGTVTKSFNIYMRTVATSSGTRTLSYTTTVYSGAAQKPTVTFKINGNTVPTSNYSVSYSNNVNVGTATVTIKGDGVETSNSTTLSFTIAAKPMSTATCSWGSLCGTYYWTGSAIKPTPSVKDVARNVTLTSGTDYTLSYSNNTNTGTATITATGKGNYSGSISTTFSIAARPLTAVNLSGTSKTYTGSSQSVTVSSVYATSKAHACATAGNQTVTSTYYSLSGTSGTNAGSYTVTATGKSGYTNSVSSSWSISAKPVTDSDVTVTLNSTSFTYTGSGLTPTVSSVKIGSVTAAGYNVSYSYSSNVNVGTNTAKVTATFSGNLSGSKTLTFSITPRAISAATKGSFGTCAYNGSSGHSRCTGSGSSYACYYNTHGHQRTQSLTYNSKTLVSGTDYTVSFSNNVSAGTATVTYTGMGNFNNTTTATWTISAMNIANCNKSYTSSYTYTGSAQGPSSFTLYLNTASCCTIPTANYSVSGNSNTSAGTYTMTFTGKTNLTGTDSSGDTSYTISPRAMSAVTVATIANQTYTAAAITPGLTVTYNGMTLTKDSHYTLSYSNNVNSGTASATLTAKSSNYTGSKTVNFTIVARSLNTTNFSVSTADSSKTYTGSALTSTVTLKYGSNTVPATYYSVSWSNNVNKGTPTITITAKKGSDNITNLSGSASFSSPMTITARAISAASKGNISACNYNGSSGHSRCTGSGSSYACYYNTHAHQRSQTLTYNGMTLGSSDYSVSYSNNVNKGTATITYSGKGNYSGTTATTWTISAMNISNCNKSWSATSFTYTGSAQGPSSFTLYLTSTSCCTIPSENYSVSGNANINAGTYAMTFTGKNNLTGSDSTGDTSYTISPRSISSASKAGLSTCNYNGSSGHSRCTGSGSSYTCYYNTHGHQRSQTLTYNSMTLVNGTDYSITYSSNVNKGTATVTYTGKGNYSSSTSTTWTISAMNIANAKFSYTSTGYTYTGSAQGPSSFTAYLNTAACCTIPQSAAYTWSGNSKTNAGTYTITFTGSSNMTGTNTANTFRIDPRAISAATKSGFGNCNYTGSTGHSRCTASTCYYNTHGHQRTQTLTYNSMTLGTSDYSYAFTNNTLKGTATITYTGKGNYTGTTSATWAISALPMSYVNFTYASTGYTYTGGSLGPTSFTGYLTSTSCCTIPQTGGNGGYTWSGNTAINAGTYTITFSATANSNCTGSNTANTFRIDQKSLNDGDTTNGTPSIVKEALGTCNYNGTSGHSRCSGTGSSLICYYNTHQHKRSQTLKYNSTLTLSSTNDYTISYAENTLKGTATVTYTGKGNYKGSTSTTWAISALPMNYVTFTYTADGYVYTTRAIGPTSFVGYLSTSTCCTIPQTGANGGYSWTGNTAVDAGTHKITFTGTGNLTGTKNTDAYVIAPRPVSDSNVKVTINPLYQLYKHGVDITDTEFQKVLSVAYDLDDPMALTTDYTFVLSNKSAVYEDTTFASANPPTVTITGKGNYTGTTTRNFLIYDNNLNQTDNCTITLPYSEHVYTGHGIEPIVTVHWKGTYYHTNPATSVDKNLTRDTDYTISYTNNVNVGTATITITGINDYNGTVTRTFKITQADISYIPQSQITLSQDTYTYTGVANTPTPTVKYQHSNLCTAVCGANRCAGKCYNDCSNDGIKTLANNTDYTYTIADNVNAGVALVTITGKGNYKGTNHTNFKINQQNMTSVVITGLSSAGYPYTGAAITPEFTATYTRSQGATPETLVYRKDFSIDYEDNVEAGTATLILTGIGNFTGEQTATFKIIALPVDIEDGRLSIEPIGSFVYTGADIEPEIHMTFNTKPLSLGADYEVAYTNNKNVGTATATITGVGNFAGTSITKTFEITKKNITELSYAHNFGSRELHTGNNITPEVTLSYNGTALKKGTDFNVTYENNRDIGQGTIKITGINNFDGNLTGNFTIFSYDMDKLEATVDTSLSSYRGKNVAVMPPITLNDPEAKFTVTYENNYQAGTATATIVGTDGYTGTIVKQFTITEANIATAAVKATAADAYFTDSEYNPDLRLEFTALNAEGTDTQTTVLEAGEDFRVTGIEVDTVNFRGVATIEGIKNFVGTRQVEFNIVARDISTATVNTLSDVTYTGEEIKPEITLEFEGTDLVEGDDYVLEYYDNINAGTAYVDVIGMGKFGGIRTLSFTIKQVKLDVNPTYISQDIYYEHYSLPELYDSSVSELGYFTWLKSSFIAGENDYVWNFIPYDLDNYEIISGEETFTAIDIQIERIDTELVDGYNYYAYSSIDRSNLIIKITYSNGDTQVLEDNQYELSVNNNDYMVAGEEIFVMVEEGGTEHIQSMGIAKARPVTVTFDGYSNLTETDGNQTISVSVDGLLEGYENVYSIVYYNLSNDTIGNSITTAGSYRVEVILSDNNYAITGASSVTFNVKTPALSNDTVSITSTDGFEGGASVDLKTYATEEELVSAYNLGDIDFGGKYLRAYSFDVVSQGIAISNNNTNTAKTVSVKLLADGIETTDNLKLYAVRQGALVALDYTVVDGKFVFDCELTDVVVFVEEMEEKSFNWAILVWSLVGLLVVGAVIGTVLYFDIRNKKANSNTSSKKTAKKSTK